ncbi:MAG: hypothetical protein MR413_01910 [Clostridia bacterium]|nr:hypothetical protein [Clostridia bacterium]
MQHTLTFTHNQKKYISKTWDFEAFCRIHEIHIKKETESLGRICGGAVDYLFEGTEATQDILDAAVADKMRMCREVWKWYQEDINAVAKNAETPAADSKPEKN